MDTKMEHPKYSIGIIGVARPEVDAAFGHAEVSAQIEGGAWDGTRSELVVAPKSHAQGSVKSTAHSASSCVLTSLHQEHSTAMLSFFTKTDAVLVQDISITLLPFARATIVIFPEGSGKTYLSLKAELSEGAELTLLEVFSEGVEIKYEEKYVLSGAGAGVHGVTLLAPSGDTVLDISTHVSHVGDHTRGDIRALGFLSGVSRTVYRATGDILSSVVAPESSEEARFIVMNKGAEISAIPSLDIASDQVTTSHKLTISRVGERELFYPELRGLSDKEGRNMILEGLLDAELACIKNDAIVSEARARIMRAL